MDDRMIEDILLAQADRLNQGLRGPDKWPDVSAEELESLLPLLQLAERTQKALAPVEPNPAFVRRLGQRLSARMAHGSREMSRRARRATLVIAAALGSAVSVASAIGLIIYLARQRSRRSHTQVSSET